MAKDADDAAQPGFNNADARNVTITMHVPSVLNITLAYPYQIRIPRNVSLRPH
jgi:hypothetical protein